MHSVNAQIDQQCSRTLQSDSQSYYRFPRPQCAWLFDSQSHYRFTPTPMCVVIWQPITLRIPSDPDFCGHFNHACRGHFWPRSAAFPFQITTNVVEWIWPRKIRPRIFKSVLLLLSLLKIRENAWLKNNPNGVIFDPAWVVNYAQAQHGVILTPLCGVILNDHEAWLLFWPRLG